jgi:exopolyphosphatase/guanosine-5'-triphosphate,3'-diphosphate pyrophosphatase
VRLVADGNRLRLHVPKRWLDARPLLRADLIGEPGPLATLGIEFILESD